MSSMKQEWVDLTSEEAKSLMLGYRRDQVGDGPDQVSVVTLEGLIMYFHLNGDPDIIQKLYELNSPVKRRKKRVK